MPGLVLATSLYYLGNLLVVTLMLEALLSKQRILEIYLNNVEWGEGLFGAQAAARLQGSRAGRFQMVSIEMPSCGKLRRTSSALARLEKVSAISIHGTQHTGSVLFRYDSRSVVIRSRSKIAPLSRSRNLPLESVFLVCLTIR